MRPRVVPLAVGLILALFVQTLAVAKDPVPATKSRVEIALLLDTSNSMDGLINQARAQLWRMVNELEHVRKNGERPELYVALYEYGNDSLNAENGYIRQVVPFTTNLDLISEKLFALTTNGGSEHCAQVITRALEDLDWSHDEKSMRSIIIAGNEVFTQGPIDFHTACRHASEAGVTITTIHCGSYQEGVQGMWADAAKLADGRYLNIDQDRQADPIATPCDKELSELSSKLNGTYCAYGDSGLRRLNAGRQSQQDENAAKAAPAAAAERATAKASGNYRNSSWDLVDAVREKTVKLEEVPQEQLPEELRKLSKDELAKHIEKLDKEREEIRGRIQKLSEERARYIAQEMAKKNEKETDTLGDAVVKAMHSLAEDAGFEFEK